MCIYLQNILVLWKLHTSLTRAYSEKNEHCSDLRWVLEKTGLSRNDHFQNVLWNARVLTFYYWIISHLFMDPDPRPRPVARPAVCVFFWGGVLKLVLSSHFSRTSTASVAQALAVSRSSAAEVDMLIHPVRWNDAFFVSHYRRKFEWGNLPLYAVYIYLHKKRYV